MTQNQASIEIPAIIDVLARSLSFRPLEKDSREFSDITPRLARSRRGLLAALDDWLWRNDQRSVERYLGRSRDVHDLEERIRNLERTSHLHF